MQAYVVQTWGQWEDEAWQAQYFQQRYVPSACQVIVLDGQDIGVIRRTSNWCCTERQARVDLL
jgi:hypothetical protein